MVVKQAERGPQLVPARLDLAQLAFFLGLRFNELVLERNLAAGFTGLRESHGFLIQHVIDSDRSVTELARRMGVTQQAASKTVAELAGLGYLDVSSGVDRRAKRVGLSRRGWQAVHASRQVRLKLESRLKAVVGARKYGAAKSTIFACLEALGGLDRIRSRRIRMPR
jgi:DNA-binding MarR family transcriptional regulator